MTANWIGRTIKAQGGAVVTLAVLAAVMWGTGVTSLAAQAPRAQAADAHGATDSRVRADFLQLIERPRVPLAPEVTPLPRGARSAQEHLTFASEAGERVPGIV